MMDSFDPAESSTMDYLFIGGSNDGERAQVPAHLGRVFRKHKFEPGRVEVYETLTIGTPDHLFTVFVFHKLRAHEAMERLIEKYPAPPFQKEHP